MKSGISIVEVLIAITILTLGISAVIMLMFGGQQFQVDAGVSRDALSKAEAMLEEARATSRQDFSLVVASSSTEGMFQKTLTVEDLTFCRKRVQARVVLEPASNPNPMRPQEAKLSTELIDTKGAIAIGGDCGGLSASGSWTNPSTVSFLASSQEATGIDVMNSFAYITSSTSPSLLIANASNPLSPSFATYTNGFGTSTGANAVDVVSQYIGQQVYAFLALNSSTTQFAVVNVTNPNAPATSSTHAVGLKNVVSTGSAPQGWRLFYFGTSTAYRLYIVTRETAGPEFHIFNVANPMNPTEIGCGFYPGTSAGRTINSLIVREQTSGMTTKRFAFTANADPVHAVSVLDVTAPVVACPSITTLTEVASVSLPGAAESTSLALVGNRLYLGRDYSSSPDLYILDVSNPAGGIPILGSKDIGTAITAIRVSGNFAYVSTKNSADPIQIFDIQDPTNIQRVNGVFPTAQHTVGLDYEKISEGKEFIYTANTEAANMFRVIKP